MWAGRETAHPVLLCMISRMNTLTDITDNRLRRMIDLCHAEVPGFALKFKDQSDLMKRLNFFAKIFNPKFMTDYTTTLGTTVYFPSETYLLNGQAAAAEVLAHELVHMVDERGDWTYKFRYAFPQILAALSLLSILAIWNLWFLLALVFLLALAPLPSPGRRDIELRGYTMSLAVTYWTSKYLTEKDLLWVRDQFVSPAYFYMWPFGHSVMRRLRAKAIDIRSGRILRDPIFMAVYRVFTTQ